MSHIKKIFDAVVIGSIGVDTNIYVEADSVEFKKETDFTENIDFVGQTGAYVSQSYTNLGKKIAYIGFVGNDLLGDSVRKTLAIEGINTEALLEDSTGTKRSVNFIFKNGERKSFYDPKNSMKTSADLELSEKIIQKANLAHFSIANWARELLPIAKKYNLTIACDLQDISAVDDEYIQDFIEQSDILFFSSANIEKPTDALKKMSEINPEALIITTMGKDGCASISGGELKIHEPLKLDMPINDTNGAGDAFATAFLSYFSLGTMKLDQAIMKGQIAALYTCTSRATSSQPIDSKQLTRYYKKETTK